MKHFMNYCIISLYLFQNVASSYYNSLTVVGCASTRDIHADSRQMPVAVAIISMSLSKYKHKRTTVWSDSYGCKKYFLIKLYVFEEATAIYSDKDDKVLEIEDNESETDTDTLYDYYIRGRLYSVWRSFYVFIRG